MLPTPIRLLISRWRHRRRSRTGSSSFASLNHHGCGRRQQKHLVERPRPQHNRLRWVTYCLRCARVLIASGLLRHSPNLPLGARADATWQARLQAALLCVLLPLMASPSEPGAPRPISPHGPRPRRIGCPDPEHPVAPRGVPSTGRRGVQPPGSRPLLCLALGSRRTRCHGLGSGGVGSRRPGFGRGGDHRPGSRRQGHHLPGARPRGLPSCRAGNSGLASSSASMQGDRGRSACAAAAAQPARRPLVSVAGSTERRAIHMKESMGRLRRRRGRWSRGC